VNVYVAGITGERQLTRSMNAYYELSIRPGDSKQFRASGRGDIARMWVCEDFLEKKEFDAILMLDLDMLHPVDMLEKMRVHDLDMVTGHYMARETQPIHSVISLVGDNRWPFPPMLAIPDEGLHEVAITGMGCVLIKRHVVEAVARRLPPGDSPFAIGPLPEATGDYMPLGLDFRFFTMARNLGYKLWLDASIECLHATTMWVGKKLYRALGHMTLQDKRLDEYFFATIERDGMDKKALELRIEKLEERIKNYTGQRDHFQRSMEIMNGELGQLIAVCKEDRFLLENWDATFPTVPEDEKQAVIDNRLKLEGVSEEEVGQAREHVAQESAMGFVEDLDARRVSVGS
jgi:hypothetical protein